MSSGKQNSMRYGLEEIPPLAVTITSALQHAMMSIGWVLSVVTILSDLICADIDDPIRSQLFSTSMFMVGIGTLVNTAFGIRLPIFQGPSSIFLIPLMALRSTGEWKCPSKEHLGGNLTYINGTNNSMTDIQNLQYERLTELQGSLMLASLFEVITGSTGLIGVVMRYIGPITMSVTITLIGLGLYEVSMFFLKSHWGISAFSTFLMMAFCMYLDHIQIPLPRFGKDKKKKRNGFPVFQTFPVLLSMLLTWGLCGILTVSGVLSDDPTTPDFRARTDIKLRILHETPWFYFPYPGQFGVPRFNLAVFIGFLVAVLNSALESIGDYHATAQACQVAPPPKHALNRGILIEGIMSVVSGAVGAGHATTSYSNHVAIISLTKIGSRVVMIIAGVITIVVSILAKFGAVFTLIPDAALGGGMFVGLGMITSLGISIATLQKVDMKSSRNLAIIGVGIYSGVVFPEWVKQNPDGINTGNIQADQIIKVLIGTPMFIGSIVAFILDNTVKGTLAERGMRPYISRQRLDSVIDTDTERDGDKDNEIESHILVDNVKSDDKKFSENVYGLPWIKALQSKIGILNRLPFLPKVENSKKEQNAI